MINHIWSCVSNVSYKWYASFYLHVMSVKVYLVDYALLHYLSSQELSCLRRSFLKRNALLRLRVKVKPAKLRYKQNVLTAKDSDEFTKKVEMKLNDAGQQNKCIVIVLWRTISQCVVKRQVSQASANPISRNCITHAWLLLNWKQNVGRQADADVDKIQIFNRYCCG